MLTELRCTQCDAGFPPADLLTCPDCGGILDVRYDLSRVSIRPEEPGIWRYRELLPIASDAVLPPLAVGWTPIYDAPRLAAALGVRALWVMDDGQNPTGSLKDRASALGVVKALEFGASRVVCASTGNAASSLAGCAASVGLPATIFVPQRAPEPKLAQLMMFGAQVFQVQASYDDAYDLCTEVAAHFGWYNRNCAINCYLVEGKKTAGLEIGERLAGKLPDWVAVSVGDGCTIAGVGKGLAEMAEMGIAEKQPKLLGVQAAGAAPVAEAFDSGGELVEMKPETIADSIAVGVPRNWRKAVKAVRDSGGAFVRVSDEQILEAMRQTARLCGVFGEPAGITSSAGVAVAREQGIIGPDESVLVLVTGNGLKDIRTAITAAGKPYAIAPTLDAVKEIVG